MEPHSPATGTFPNQPSKPRRRWPWLLGGIIVVLALIALYTHRRSQAPAGGGRFGGGTNAVMISTATARIGDIGEYINALGTVTPVYTVAVEARVAGQIMKVNYRQGQDVRIGDSLLEIDPRPYEAAVTEAEGQLAHDQAALKVAQTDMERYREAAASNAIPVQEYEDQVYTVQQDEGTVQMDQGNLDNARVNLAYCHITSPIAGRVGLRLVDPGNIVQANGATPLAIITQLQPITVIFFVSEDYLSELLPAVHENKHLTVDVFDRNDLHHLATGAVEALDNEVNTNTGTLNLRAVFDNRDESLFPYQFVNVRLLVNTLTNAVLLPNTAIQRNDTGAFVYLVQTNQTVAQHAITVGVTDETESEVQGLEEGDVVAADNFNRLMDGARVTLRPANGGNGGGSHHSSGGGNSAGQHHRQSSQ